MFTSYIHYAGNYMDFAPQICGVNPDDLSTAEKSDSITHLPIHPGLIVLPYDMVTMNRPL